MLLRDKIVLVTGAGQGLGRGIALAVAEAGGDLALLDLHTEPLQETATLVERRGQRALAVQADVTDAGAVSKAFEKTVAAFGRLDGLVNNAGVVTMAPALDIEAADWERHFAVNVRGLFGCCRLAARQMRAQGGGAIVNIASNAGKVGYANMAAYNASKAAVINLTRSLSAEWAGDHINVNAVCPGGVETAMLADVGRWVARRVGGDPQAIVAAMKPKQMTRLIQPVEVGRVVAFLLSEHALIIRGQALNVDGGDTPY